MSDEIQQLAEQLRNLRREVDELKRMEFAQNVVIPPVPEDALPTGYLFGLTLSNNSVDATNDMDITTGKCRDGTDAVNMALASALTKRLDATWVVGTNQGGLDEGVVGNNTYHVWLIKRSDTGVVDVLFSLSLATPTMPTSYNYKRRIGSIVRTGGAIKAFKQDGDTFVWKVPVGDVAATNPGTSAVSRTLTVPAGIRVEAILSAVGRSAAGAADNPTSVFISDLSTTDTLPDASVFNTIVYNGGAVQNYSGTMMRVFTDTSAQVRSRVGVSTANTILYISTHGWMDARGRS